MMAVEKEKPNNKRKKHTHTHVEHLSLHALLWMDATKLLGVAAS
jgi:hypothetical protein